MSGGGGAGPPGGGEFLGRAPGRPPLGPFLVHKGGASRSVVWGPPGRRVAGTPRFLGATSRHRVSQLDEFFRKSQPQTASDSRDDDELTLLPCHGYLPFCLQSMRSSPAPSYRKKGPG